MCESRDLDPGHDLGKVACYQATPHSPNLLNTYHYLYFKIRKVPKIISHHGNYKMNYHNRYRYGYIIIRNLIRYTFGK